MTDERSDSDQDTDDLFDDSEETELEEECLVIGGSAPEKSDAEADAHAETLEDHEVAGAASTDAISELKPAPSPVPSVREDGGEPAPAAGISAQEERKPTSHDGKDDEERPPFQGMHITIMAIMMVAFIAGLMYVLGYYNIIDLSFLGL